MLMMSFNLKFLILVVTCFSQALCFKDYVLRDLGCWKDTGNRAIPTIESRLSGNYKARQRAIQQCAHAAKILGYSVFAVQDGGWCASGPHAVKTYAKYGPSDKCHSDGEGGPWANQVYEIETVLKVNYRPVGCFKDTEVRAIATVEKRFVDLHSEYEKRADAIGKCSRIAASLNHKVFAVQNGGWCATASNAHQTYNKYGPSQDCKGNGKGGPWANDVYEVTEVEKISLARLGCHKDAEQRALPFLERPEVLPGKYQERPDAIEQCIRYASGLGYVIVGIQNGGSCMAGTHYDKYGYSNHCKTDSKGGVWANEVFKVTVIKLEIPLPSLPRYQHYYLNNLGCWKDTQKRAIPVGLEGSPVLIGEYQKRKDAIQKCAEAAASRGFNVIGVQNGGQCWSGVNARNTYYKYGVSDKCGSHGRGGYWANQVYEINTIFNPVFTGLGCYKDTSNRALTVLEKTSPVLSDDYQKRSDAVRKCARVAAGFGNKVFGVQNGGHCQSSPKAESQYMKYGRADNCGRGRGGSWSNSVYKITNDVDFYIESRGCWADDAYRTIPTVEGAGPEFMAHKDYKTREDAIAKCARYALTHGFSHFALQDGGYCSTSADAGYTYRRIGPSQRCQGDGKGGPWANHVYAIVPRKLP